MDGFRFKWTCPHCGHENSMFREWKNGSRETELRHCDCETGGCDRLVIITTRPLITVDYELRKVDEEPDAAGQIAAW